jgi:hypothetical protein
VQPTNPCHEVVVADEHLVSHAGIGLLAELPTGSGSPGRWASSRAQTAAGPAATSQPGCCAT